jgi:protein SCO1/2
MASKKSKLHSNKVLLVILLYALIVIGLLTYVAKFRPHNNIRIHGTYINNPKEISEFHLIDEKGKSLTKKRFKSHWTILFFGFTNCTMVCPTTLTELSKMYNQLEKDLPENKVPQIVFISVDPARDNLARLKQFIHAFNPHFIAARARADLILALEKELHLTISSENLLNHSMEIILLNPEVRAQAYFSYPHEASQLVKDYKLIVKI